MAVTADKPAPYAPPRAILDIIGRHRQRGAMATVTAETLGRAGVTQSLIPRTLQALQTLGLITQEGKATATFDGIRLAPETEYKKRLEEWLKGAYADVFSFVDPTKDDETRVRDAFRGYQPAGQQSRMVILFRGLCVAAGLVHEKSVPRARSRPSPSHQRPAPSNGQAGGKPAHYPTGGGTNIQASVPPALAGLLASLPPNGTGWTKAKRDQFVNTFGAVLDFCVPIVKHEPATSGESKENGGPHPPL